VFSSVACVCRLCPPVAEEVRRALMQGMLDNAAAAAVPVATRTRIAQSSEDWLTADRQVLTAQPSELTLLRGVCAFAAADIIAFSN
jgi:hypothetical protein